MNYQLLALFVILPSLVFVCLTVGFASLFRTRAAVKNWRRANGTVVEMVKRGRTKGGNLMTTPRVRFVAPDGREIEFTEWGASYPPRYRKGERVTVLFQPENHGRARVLTTHSEMYWFAYLWLGLGAVFLAGGIVLGSVYAAGVYFLGTPGAVKAGF